MSRAKKAETSLFDWANVSVPPPAADIVETPPPAVIVAPVTAPVIRTEPVATAPVPVGELHPDCVRVRHERDDIHWVERRRGGRSSACVTYSWDELVELREALNRYIAKGRP